MSATGLGGRATPVKLLVVGEDFPWPANRGGLIRLGKIIEALAALGEVDLFTLYDRRRTSFPVPEGLRLARQESTLYPTPDRVARWRAAWATHRDLPLEVAMRNGDQGPRRHFEGWVADHYDAVWFDKPAVFHWLGRPRLGPTIVDIDNLEDEKAMQWARVLRDHDRGGGAGAWLRTRAAAGQSVMNAHRWRNLQQAVAAQVDRVVLCTDTDAHRTGFRNTVVLPNGYTRPDRVAGDSHPGPGRPPVVLLQGTLTYPPNMDAVEWLIGRVAPRLWAEWPQVEIRLVGNPAPGVQRWDRPPGGHRGRKGARHGAGAGKGGPGGGPPAGGQRHPDQDPRILRPPDPGGVHHPRCRRAGGRGRGPPADGRRPRRLRRRLWAAAGRHRPRKRLVDAAEGLYLEHYQWSSAKDHIGQIVAQVTGR